MATAVKVYGSSDDLIEIEGDIREEFNVSNGNGYLAFSDGTVLSVEYDRNGIWRFNRIIGGNLYYRKDENPPNDDERYSDIVVLDADHPGEVQWVVFATDLARA